jgi:APA family basic amino acid/polyamine antiporter
VRFAAFPAAGFLVYVLYGRRNSRLAAAADEVTPDAAAPEPQAV